MPEVGNEMNGLFFLVPFLIIGVPIAYAETGYDYFKTDNGDGTFTLSKHLPYVYDGNDWVKFIQAGNQIQTAHGNVTLNPDGSYSWSNGIEDRIVVKYADITDLTSWTYPNALNNDTPDNSWNGTAFVSSKIKSGVGHVDYIYADFDGAWKTQLEATNLSGLTTKVFGFDEIFDIPTDTIKFGGVARNLDNFDGVTFDKQFLENNEGKVLNLLNGVNFDFDKGFENLYSVTVYDTGVNSSQLVFDYRTSEILLPGETLIIDPTITDGGTGTGLGAGNTAVWTHGGAALTATGNIESVAIDLTTNAGGNIKIGIYDRSGADPNNLLGQEAFAIPGGTGVKTFTFATPIAVTGDFNIAVIFDTVGNTMDGDAVGAARETGTTYAAQMKDPFNKTSSSGNGYWVQIVYSTGSPPNPITSLSYANLNSNSVDIIFTLPTSNGTGTFQTFTLNSTTPFGAPLTFNQNTTNIFANVTGLTFGTDYSFRAALVTEISYNTTGSYILNITTPTTVYSGVAPTDLTVNDCYHTCTTQLNLEWTAALMDSINGFRIFFETPIGNGFTTLTSNTTTTTTYYNDTGLTPGQFYNYKVAALNGSGISENSTAYAQSPHKLPDSVTDLVITTNDVLQFLGSWTAPDLFGTLNGYQINYTTPAGDPQTIYTSTNPGVTATISGLNPTVEYSFKVAANTYHGINATFGNIENATASSEIAVGDLSFDPGDNPDVEPIWYENYIVDTTTNDVQVRFNSALTVDCTITERIANNVSTYNGLSETAAIGYVYHNFTVTNAGNDILDWDCYDQSDSTINGQYSLTQSESASGAANIPMFGLMANFTGGLYGTEGEFAGIDLITLFIVIVSMLGFNKKNPALGVGIMATLLGAAWYYELIPWTSGVLGGIAVVVVLAIGQGLKKD